MFAAKVLMERYDSSKKEVSRTVNKLHVLFDGPEEYFRKSRANL